MDLEKSKSLRHILNKIFFGTSSNKLEEIEQILNKEGVYSGTDTFVIDLNGSHLNQILSNAEMLKLEEYFKKAEMDLTDFLRIVFPNKNQEKYTKMIENLEREGFESSSDLKYLDEEVTNNLESFNRIEIKKLKDYFEKNETLEEVLSEIFTGTPRDRITEIERFLKENDIYVRKDVLDIDIKILTSEFFFSRNELVKIESFLQKNNKDYYNKIMNKKEIYKSDLNPTLHKIFSGTSTKKITEIEEILKGQSITAKKDLVFINLDKFKKENILPDIEILKIEAFLEESYKEQFFEIKKKTELEKSESLGHVLNKIFVGTSRNRLEEIEQILNKLEIYSGKDIFIIDLNSSYLKESVSNAEMLKFEEYFKKKYPVQYEKLMSDREFEKTKDLKCVLKQIFMDTPDDRLAEIENILKNEHINSGSDMKIVDTNTLREKNSLKDIEILKIEEYIKKNYRERYEEIKAVKIAEDERKCARLKMEEEIKFYALKQEEELKFLQLKEQEELKMIEFKSERERLLREEEMELMKAKAKEEMERKNIKLQREKELMEARTMNEMKREDIKLQREKTLRAAKFKEEMEREKINFQREKDLMEAKSKEDMEKEKFEQRKIELNVAKAKVKKETQELKTKEELETKRYESLIDEKKRFQDDIRGLENECILLKGVITQNSQKGIFGLFKNDSVELQKAKDEYEFRQESLKSKSDRITAIDQELRDINISRKVTRNCITN